MKSKYLYADDEIEILVSKHGTHDQKTHGNWAHSGETTITSLIDKLSEKKTPGFTIDIRTKTSPKTGFIASDRGAEQTHDWATIGASRDTLRTSVRAYLKDHAELLDDSGAFFGAWVDNGVLYFDVSRRYPTRSEGVAAGFKNEQKAIYDVVNDAYIYMEDELNGATEKARAGGSAEASEGYDRDGTGRIRGRDSGLDSGQSVEPHVCLGRASTVQKHLDGQHDQRTHGNWAGDRYPEDSVKSARDGALDYAYKKGLDYDESIDYTKVVANRQRASRIADIYETLPEMDRDAVDEYEALATEVEEQFDFMTKTLGIKVEFVADDPYKTSKEMFADVSQGRLKVLQTATTGAHPLFSDDQNDKFRAVHDFFGHAATGRGFGQDGEEAAWVHHSQMFTDKARAALTTETRGQNSFFNNRGKQFADQKVALLPEEFWEVPEVFAKSQVIRFAFGLKPVLKHMPGQHNQKKHGKWADQGYTETEAEGISSMEGKGPTLADLDKVLAGGDPITDEDLAMFVMNDSIQYDEFTNTMNVQGEVDSRVAQLESDLARPLTEQEKVNIFEEVQNESLDNYLNGRAWMRESVENAYRAENPSGSASDLDGFFREVYDVEVEYEDENGDTRTIASTISDITMEDETTISLEGFIEADGENVGNFIRKFYKNDDGTWSVEHKWLSIDDAYQGKGFGQKFLAQSEDWYTAAGVRDIILMAGLEDGARHWARAGFDWDKRSIWQSMNKLSNVIQYNSDDYSDQDKDEFRALLDRAADVTVLSNGMFDLSIKDMTNDDFPFPAEFANLGWDRRTRDADGEWDWAGKRLMQGQVLDYVKPITAEGRSLLEGPIDRDGDGLVYDGTGRERPAPQK